MNSTWIRYIIQFLSGDDISPEIVSSIGYTNKNFHDYSIVIIPSGFFDEASYGHKESIPGLPLQEIEGVPLLFGKPETEMQGATLIVKADIIASAYFLITRYEEMIRRHVRDEHGRFPGKESLPFRAGFINRPVVDEYRVMLRRWLQMLGFNVPPVTPRIRNIYLTHDVDEPFLFRSWKGLIRSVLSKRGIVQSVSGKFGSVENDPYYTFPQMIRADNNLIREVGENRCKSIYFFRSGGRAKQDKPDYNLAGSGIRYLLNTLKKEQAVVGLHASYEAGLNPFLIKKERQRLSNAAGEEIIYNRHHFLRCREPEDMLQLEAAGISHDFTMGYADVSGFRLGTAWPVCWINPVNKRLSALTLHPLHIMDCTIESEKYMGLPPDEGKAYCLNIINNIEKTGGELSLLWHNTSFVENEDGYQHSLYLFLLKKLAGK